MRRFLKYSMVGVGGTLLDLVVLYVLVDIMSLGIIFSSVLPFLVAATNNFFFNKFWTFRNKDPRHRLQYVKFVCVSVVGFILTLWWMIVFTKWAHLWYLHAKVLTSAIVLLWNFLGNNLWTFREREEEEKGELSSFPYGLSVIIPCYNEEKRICNTLKEISGFLMKENIAYEILVINDGSNDATEKIVNEEADRFENIKCISLSKNKGKGFAIKIGFQHAQGEFILYTDADNATPIKEVRKMLAFMEDCDIAIGSRKLKDSVTSQKPLIRKYMSFLSGFLTGMIVKDIKDTQCGFKLFRHGTARFLAQSQTINRYAFDMELLAIAQTNNIRIREIPVTWVHGGDSKLRPFVDSMKYLFDFLSIRLNLLLERY